MDNRESSRKLIQLYGTKELLWNSKSLLHHNKALREDAWREISGDMRVPVPDLKKKITVLLSSYRREKWRISKSQITGSGRDSIYVSKWFAFNDFSFMQDKCTPNDTIDTMQDNINKTPDDTTYSSQEPSSENGESTQEPSRELDDYKITTKPTKNPKKRKQEDEENNMLTEAFKILKDTSQPTDPYFSYGQHIGNELRKYDTQTLLYVKQAINNIIFEADLGKYTPLSTSDTWATAPSQDDVNVEK